MGSGYIKKEAERKAREEADKKEAERKASEEADIESKEESYSSDNKSSKVNEFFDEIIHSVSDEVINIMDKSKKSIKSPIPKLAIDLQIPSSFASLKPALIYNVDELKSNIVILE